MIERNSNFKFDFMPLGQAIKKARESKGMTREQLIEIAEKLNKWLDDISAVYQIDKTDLQDIIKHFLIG